MQIPSLPVSPERLQKVLPAAAALLFTVLLGLEASRLIWQLVPMPDQGGWVPRPASADQSASAPAQQAGLNIQPLLAARLFGQYKAQEAPVVATVEAPDTNLRLKLRGIIEMEEERLSRAMIEASNGDLESYALGQSVPGGASLHAIFTDRVLLRRGGRLETLRLEKDAPSTALAEYSSAASGYKGEADSAARVLDSSTAAKLTNIRNELLNDPTKASQYLRVQPARQNGAMKGYRIYPGRNRDLFREAGLRPGDIVTAINGVALDDPSRSLQLLSDLSSAQQFNLTIERGGQNQSLSVTLN